MCYLSHVIAFVSELARMYMILWGKMLCNFIYSI